MWITGPCHSLCDGYSPWCGAVQGGAEWPKKDLKTDDFCLVWAEVAVKSGKKPQALTGDN
jgi:hypothetical protein